MTRDPQDLLDHWVSKANEDRLVNEVPLDHRVRSVLKALKVRRVLKDHQGRVVLPAPQVHRVRQGRQVRRDQLDSRATLALRATWDRRASKDSKDRLEVAVIPATLVPQGRGEVLGRSAREVLSGLLVLRVDLEAPGLRDREDPSDCQDLRERQDQQVYTH